MKIIKFVPVAIVLCCAVLLADAQVLKRTTVKTESIPIGPAGERLLEHYRSSFVRWFFEATW